MRRIRNTSAMVPLVVSTSQTMRPLDPDEVARALGAEVPDITGRTVMLRRVARRSVGKQHWREFSDQRGVVLGHPQPGWPEWDVRWESGLKYAYPRAYLELLP